jgi:hypothetical protein
LSFCNFLAASPDMQLDTSPDMPAGGTQFLRAPSVLPIFDEEDHHHQARTEIVVHAATMDEDYARGSDDVQDVSTDSGSILHTATGQVILREPGSTGFQDGSLNIMEQNPSLHQIRESRALKKSPYDEMPEAFFQRIKSRYPAFVNNQIPEEIQRQYVYDQWLQFSGGFAQLDRPEPRAYKRTHLLQELSEVCAASAAEQDGSRNNPILLE